MTPKEKLAEIHQLTQADSLPLAHYVAYWDRAANPKESLQNQLASYIN